MDIKGFAEKFIKAEYEAWHEGKFDALEKVEDPDVTYHQISMGWEVKGFEAHKQQIMALRQAAPGVRIELKYVTGDGNVFAAIFTAGGAKFTVQAPGLPPPTGKDITANSLFVFRINKGRIAEAWSIGSVGGLT
jgi:ketosteroid isomerase-like protein